MNQLFNVCSLPGLLLSRHFCAALLCSYFLLRPPICFATSQQSPINSINPSVTHEYILKNGLKLIVREKSSLPVASVQIWYKVGAAYEQASASGTSHFLEHLMFRGTTNVAGEMFSKLASRNGSVQNAYTTKDATVFYHEANKQDLELILLLEADRMTNLNITEEGANKEKQIILQELLQYDNNSIAKMADLFFMNAHLGSFYQKPIIGWPADVQRMSKKKLQRWYSQWYTPDNAVIVVVGDVSAEHTLKLVEKYFGPIKTQKYGTIEPMDELQTTGLRQLNVTAKKGEEFLLLGYNVPSVHTADAAWEPFALELIAALLDGGYSTRFGRNLIRGQKVANRANSWYSPFQLNATLFLITASPAVNVSLQQLEQNIFSQIEQLKTNLISEAELSKIKHIAKASAVYDRDSNFNQAFNIGSLEASYYSWQESSNYLTHIDAITSEQIQQVAKKYFVADRTTIGRLTKDAL